MTKNSEGYNHLKVEGYKTDYEYEPVNTGRGPVIRNQDRGGHGSKIKGDLETIQDEFQVIKETELPEDFHKDNVIYVEFFSETGVEPIFDKLDSDARQPGYKIVNVKKQTDPVNEKNYYYKVVVALEERGLNQFIQKINSYLNENTEYGEPKNKALFNNLNAIKKATIEAFWSEHEGQYPFPEMDKEVWWEVWFRRKDTNDEELEDARSKTINQLEAIEAKVGNQELKFPEHYIWLVKATPRQLADSLMFLDNLAELRKPRETADFFDNLTVFEREEFINEFQERIENHVTENSIAICLLDSGVNRGHPLLSQFLPTSNMHSYNEDWGEGDGWPGTGGHVTGMAGLALYDNLVHAFESTDQVRIYHQLESVKIINRNDPNDPELYGYVTQESANRPKIDYPERTRIYCMAVTDKDQSYSGRPSSWSSSVDAFTFDDTLNEDKQLFIVSGGNVVLNNAEEFKGKNLVESVHDPGQAFNSLTIGAYTELYHVDQNGNPGEAPLAEKGGMGPSNTTSFNWEESWPIKPDIVMEGGNLTQNLIELPSLSLLTTSKEFRTTYFQTFKDTSAATALASRFAAKLWQQYPELWPETIRGLMVHSADWTPQMTRNQNLTNITAEQTRAMLRSYGFGVPNYDDALYSASNSLTLIAEETIQPYQAGLNNIKYNEINFFELPWPVQVLKDQLTDTDVTLKITLSYFIEPNPGNRRYAIKYNYQSHGLNFNLKKAEEDFDEFYKRVSKTAREKDEQGKVIEKGFSGEKNWALGQNQRDKGSIHKDLLTTSGADLSTRNMIAIYPTTGWYKSRSKLNRYEDHVRYSLIVTIETEEENVDIYTPVVQEIGIPF